MSKLKVIRVDMEKKEITFINCEDRGVEFTPIDSPFTEEVWAGVVQVVSLDELLGISEPLTLEELEKKYPKK